MSKLLKIVAFCIVHDHLMEDQLDVLLGFIISVHWLYARIKNIGYKYGNWVNNLILVSHSINSKNSLLLTKRTCLDVQDKFEF